MENRLGTRLFVDPNDTTTKTTTPGTKKRGRKRQRHDNSVRSFLGATGPVYSMASFFQSYIPALPPLESMLQQVMGISSLDAELKSGVKPAHKPQPDDVDALSRAEILLLFQETLLTPIDENLAPLTKLRMPTLCSQSLTSLIQDCVWTLVQRRDSHRNVVVARKEFHRHNNLLCQGFVTTDKSQRGGVPPLLLTQRQLNAGTDCCTTSPLFQTLHVMVGDDVVRYLLLNAHIFLPILNEQKDGLEGGNYWQVAGPPLTLQNPTTTWKPCDSNNRHRLVEKGSVVSLSSSTESKESAIFGGTECTTTSLARRRLRKHQRQRPITCVQLLPVTATRPDHPLKPQSCVHRKPLFYSNSFTKTVGDGLLLYESPDTLWRDMTSEYRSSGSSSGCEGTKRSLSDEGVVEMSRAILRRHGQTDYHRLLQRLCPLPENYTSASLADLPTRCHSPHERVVAFCQSCVASVFPNSFWGKPGAAACAVISRRKKKQRKDDNRSTSTRDQITNATVFLQQTIPNFVTLRRNERLANKVILQNLRITHMTWLTAHNQDIVATKKNACSRMDHERRKLLVLSILRWVFHKYIIPLLQQVFYVTESEFHGKRVLYYRKPVWALFRTLSMKKVLGWKGGKTDGDGIGETTRTERVQYTELSESEAATRLRRQHMGLSRLRFVPKATGVRPIATLCKREIMTIPVQAGGRTTVSTKDYVDEEDIEIDTSRGLAPLKRMNADTSPLSSTSPVPDTATCQQQLKVKASNQSHSPTNALLGDAFAVLSYEYSRQRVTFGSGLMGLHHFYPRYRRFLQQWKLNQNDEPVRQRHKEKIFFGSVDIRHCYDNINQDHLLTIVDRILTENDYVIQKYSVSHAVDSSCRIRRQQKKDVGLPEHFDPFSNKVRILAKEHYGSIFIDGVNFVAISKEQIMDQLREHLTSHMVVTKGRYGNRYLLQSTGIPQGSIISSLLCNFYYGDVECRLLDCRCGLTRSHAAMGGTCEQNDSAKGATNKSVIDLLARMVDDFLLVTTELVDLERFFLTMHRGDARLGVEINKDKTNSSADLKIPVDDGSTDEIGIKARVESDFFSWCGMLFDTITGEVRIDYNRFVDGRGGDDLTVERVSHEGEQLLVQMKRFVRPRCIPILFDPFINTLTVQVVNFYQMMVYSAVKTVEYLRSLGNELAPRTPLLSNPHFLVCGIESTIDFGYNLIKGRLKMGLHGMSVGSSTDGLLKPAIAIWLGWRAYYDVFRQLPNGGFQLLANTVLVTRIRQKHANKADTTLYQGLEQTILSAYDDIQLSKLIEIRPA